MANGFLPLLRYLHRIAGGTPGGGLTDAQLLERFVRQRDEAAFAVLFQRHGRMVWNVCWRILRDSHQAEDAFQATFLVLVRKANSVVPRDHLPNWLYGVAFRIAKKAKVQTAKRHAQQKEMPDMSEYAPIEAPDWNDLSAVLDEEVRHLPTKYRQPLVLCYLEGRSTEEAARQLGCLEGTLSVWLTRGREKLRQRLQRRGMVVPAAALTALLVENAASAAMPPGLADSTLSLTHTVLATGQLSAASATVAALTQGAIKDMVYFKLKIAAGILAATVALTGSGWVVQQALADKPQVLPPPESAVAAAPAEKAAHASKLDLTPESLAKFRDLVRPSDKEWRHVKIKWLTDIVAARKKAAQEDKPIVIFRTGGAGYNDPLGVC